MNLALLPSIVVAFTLLEVTLVKACVFTNYTGDSAPVEQIGNFFTAESIHDCMWHCYNAGECVFLRYRSLNKSCLLYQKSNTVKVFDSRRDHLKTIQLYEFDRQPSKTSVKPSCQLQRLSPSQ
ncbi:hypothetical protein V3C99_006393 [Haemonchus contortus]